MLLGSLYLIRRSTRVSTILLFLGSSLYVLIAALMIISSVALRDTRIGTEMWLFVTRWAIWINIVAGSLFSIGFFLYARREKPNS